MHVLVTHGRREDLVAQRLARPHEHARVCRHNNRTDGCTPSAGSCQGKAPLRTPAPPRPAPPAPARARLRHQTGCVGAYRGGVRVCMPQGTLELKQLFAKGISRRGRIGWDGIAATHSPRRGCAERSARARWSCRSDWSAPCAASRWSSASDAAGSTSRTCC
jgi:hypothetical protein